MIRHTEDPPNIESALRDLEGVAPTERLYVRCNFGVPRLDAGAWRLKVSGSFREPRTWTLSELARLPMFERTVVLECARNGRTLMSPVPAGTPWGLGAVGTARFGGVRLSDVVGACGPLDEVIELVFTGADHGSVDPEGSIPYQFNLDLDDALADGPMLAWTINGEPLTPDHGFPVRLVVPGHYGMQSVKWLRSIAAVTQPFHGHFPQKYRYRGERGIAEGTPVGPMRVRSLFTSPTDGDTLSAEPMTLRGVAWSGGGAITSVEVGIDATWVAAELIAPTEVFAPTAWSVSWTPEPGHHELRVRAVDAAGNRQPVAPVWNEGGYGNNLVQRIAVEVSERSSRPPDRR